MNEEGAHEEADADEEVEGVDEWSTPLWAKGKNKEHAVSRKKDSIASKLKNVKNGRKEGIGGTWIINGVKDVKDIWLPEGIDKPGAVEDSA